MYSDLYSKSEIIAIIDSDVVLTSYCMNNILVSPIDKNPILFCTWHRGIGPGFHMGFPSKELDLDIIDPRFRGAPTSCMEGLPFMFRRSTLINMRKWLKEKTGIELSKLFFIWNSKHIAGQFSLMGAYAWVFERDRYHWGIGGRDKAVAHFGQLSPTEPINECPEIRGSMHVPYARKGWNHVPKLHKTFFAEAQFALLHGACRAQKICRPEKVSNTCNSILKQRNEQEYYLSFERQNEMMFGNMPPYVGQNAHRMSPKCIKQYQSRLQSSCIRETQCSYLPKCVGKNCPPGSTTLQ